VVQETGTAGDKRAEDASHVPQDPGGGTTVNESVGREYPDDRTLGVTPIPEDAIDQGPILDDQEDDPIDNDENNDDAGNGGESADIEMDDANPMEVARRSRRRDRAETATVDITPAGRSLRSAPLPPASTPGGSITVSVSAAHRLRSSGPNNAPPQDVPHSTAKETSSKK
jgi:hypothetical protein